MERNPLIVEHETRADEALADALKGMQRFADELLWLFDRDAHLDAGHDSWEQYLVARWGSQLGLTRPERQGLAQALVAIVGSQGRAAGLMGVSRAQVNRLVAGKTGHETRGVRQAYTMTRPEIEESVARVTEMLDQLIRAGEAIVRLAEHPAADPVRVVELADRLAVVEQEVLDVLEHPERLPLA